MSQHDNVVHLGPVWQNGLDFVRTEKQALKQQSLHNLVLFLKHHPELKGLLWYDEFADQIMLDRQVPTTDAIGPFPREWADTDETALTGWLNAQGLNPSIAMVGAAIRSQAMQAVRNPQREWADTLVWDGKRRIDTWLNYFAGVEDTDYSRLVGRRFLISAMARALNPGCKVDSMLILEGAQGLKKSSMIDALAGPGWFTDQIGDITSKDASQLLQGVWLIEVAEMDKFSRHETSAVKAFLTRRFDRYRPPYGRNVVKRDRRCVFFGTINPDGAGYLRDVTGNRRYWPVTVRSIDLEGIQRERHQLWAEARNAFVAGERWWIDPEEDTIVLAEQEARRDDDPWEPTVEAWLGEIEQRMARGFVSADILRKALDIKLGEQSQAHKKRLSKILTVLGYESVNHRNGIRGRSWQKKGERA